jgi:cyclopropane fatty-acyl-phospholipid synthase-like methyltransferase
MQEDRLRWEQRYTDRSSVPAPSRFILDHAEHARGRVLDIAGGSGRNALFLARLGCRVHIVDISRNALKRALAVARAEDLIVEAVQLDLDTWQPPADFYDTLINIRYLQRSLFPAMKRTVKPGGVVLFETFLIDQQRLGHPKNPDFLLQRGELRQSFADFQIIEYREGLLDGEAPAYLAQLVARRPQEAL